MWLLSKKRGEIILSKYVIIHGRFYEVSDDELMHWGIKKGEARDDHKYIKREWKNGRWQYTYPNGANKTNSNNVKPANSPKKDNKITAYVKGIKKDIAESKTRADKPYYQSPVKVGINTAKEFVKDRFGYDEKRQYQKTKEQYEDAKDDRKSMTKWHKETNDEKKSSMASGQRDKAAKANETEKLIKEWLIEDRAEETASYNIHKNAENDYKKTALYKVEKVGTAISNLSENVGDNIREFSKSTKHAFRNGKEFVDNVIDDVSNTLSDVAFDVAWEVEYQSKKALGMNAKNHYDFELDVVAELDKELRKAKYQYDNSHKHDYDYDYYRWQYDRAVKRYDSAVKDAKEARDKYARTPAGMIDIGHEYVEDWFEQLSKKRKNHR